jgi:hypothetical protein
MKPLLSLAALLLLTGLSSLHADDTRAEPPPLVRTARSGAWSDKATWEGGKVEKTAHEMSVTVGR